MKKLALSCVAALSLLTLAACGSGSESKANGKKGDTVQLKFAFWGDSLEKSSIEKLVKNFNESQEAIEVVAQQIPGDNYMEKLNTMASTNSLPDIGYMKENSTAEWGASGKLRDLTELYEEGGIFADKIEETRSEYNGVTYGAPAGPGMTTLFYNTKYFEKNNIDIPPYSTDTAWDWNQFVDTLMNLTVDRNGKHPDDAGFDEKNIQTYGVNNFTWLYESFLISNGGGLVSEDGKSIEIGKAESIEALDNLKDLMYKYHVMPKPSQSSTIPSADTAMLTDRVAITIDGSWNLRTFGEAIEKKGLQLGMGVLPKMGDKVVQVNFGPPIVVFNTDKTEKNWEEAKTFLEYVQNPDNSLEVIQSGLWLPNQNNWFTDKTELEKWTTGSQVPEYKAEAMISAKDEAQVKNKAFYFEDTTSLEQIVNPALEQVWTGKKDAEEVVKEDIIPKLKKEFGDKYEIVE